MYDALPKYVILDKIETDDAISITQKFNETFVNVGPHLATKIGLFQKKCKQVGGTGIEDIELPGIL